MAELKQFTYRLAGFFSVQALVSLVFLSPYLLKHDQVVKQGFMAATNDKYALLRQQKQPRIVWVGGSSVVYGVNSPYVAEQLKYQPVNLGLHAGFGVEYMLNEVEPGLQAGDVVVVSLEYENFEDFPPGPKDVFDVLEARPQNIEFLPLSYVPAMLDKGLIFTGGVLRRSAMALAGDLDRKPYYRRDSFNEYGDIVAHYNVPNLTEKVTTDTKTFKFTDEDIDRVVRRLNLLHERCRTKNIQVFYSYAPLVDRLVEASRPEINKIQAAFKQSLQFPVLDTPDEVGYSDEYYFDTRYHLDQRGSQKRSEHLVEKLSPYLSGRKSAINLTQ
jgi:hypothetical protein